MQAVKNILSSHKDEQNTSTNPSHNSQPGYTTASSGAGNDRLGSTTGDSARTGLTSGNTAGQTGAGEYADTTRHGSHHPSGTTGNLGTATGATSTNTSATRDTGLATDRSADTTTGGAGRVGRALDHSSGHDHSIASKFDPSAANTTHDHKHLAEVTHRDVRHVEVEEVERQRELDRHIHHVQHHVQPIVDKQVQDEVHHHNTVPVTTINERHTSTAEDKGLFDGLASQHRDTETHRGKERTIVDLGERVHENLHHHVHHVTQPVVEQEVVDRHRIHTVIPTHHVSHEAPIIHKSSTHEPVTMDAFVKGGGQLGSGIRHDQAGLLNTGECERTVDGVGEKLARDLSLGGIGSGAGSGGRYVDAEGERHHTRMGQKVDDIGDRRNTDGTTGSGRYVDNEGDRHRTSVGQRADDAMDRNRGDGTTGSGKYVADDGERHKTSIGKKADDMNITS